MIRVFFLFLLGLVVAIVVGFLAFVRGVLQTAFGDRTAPRRRRARPSGARPAATQRLQAVCEGCRITLGPEDEVCPRCETDERLVYRSPGDSRA